MVSQNTLSSGQPKISGRWIEIGTVRLDQCALDLKCRNFIIRESGLAREARRRAMRLHVPGELTL